MLLAFRRNVIKYFVVLLIIFIIRQINKPQFQQYKSKKNFDFSIICCHVLEYFKIRITFVHSWYKKYLVSPFSISIRFI